MAQMVSGNPALESESAQQGARPVAGGATMSVAGTALKTLVLLAFVVLGGVWGWSSATEPVAQDVGSGYANTTVTIPGGFWLASFGALFVGIFVAMNPRLAAIGGVVYGLLQGYVLGAISAAFDAQTEGIVGAAILATVAVFAVAWLLYITRIIKPTRRMAYGVAAGLGGLSLFYLVVWMASVFNWGWRFSDGFQTVGVIVTVIAVVLAALSFTLDFASIDAWVAAGAPKQMEWYSAYGLMVTFIWLYITLLRLLSFLARNR